VHASHGAQSKIQPPVSPSPMHDQQTPFRDQKLYPAPGCTVITIRSSTWRTTFVSDFGCHFELIARSSGPSSHCVVSDICRMSAHTLPRAHRGDDKAGGSHNANHQTAVQTPSDSQGDDANDASMNGTSSGFAPTLEPAPLTRFPSDLGLKSPMTGFLDNPSLPRYGIVP